MKTHNMKGENRLKILEFLEGSTQALEELFVIFTSPYGTSRRGIEYRLNKHRERRVLLRDPVHKRNQLRFYDLLYRLRKDELVKKGNNGKKFLIELTNKGREVLDKLRNKRQYNPSRINYKPERDNTLKIIIFDIPETERTKRAWLRDVLRNLEFQMLQRSV